MSPVTSDEEKRAVDGVPKGLFVGGHWGESVGGDVFPVEDPSTGAIIATVADGTVGDIQRALDAACAAQPGWARTPPRERGEILRRAFETMVARSDELALVMTLEMGKPLAESLSEVVYAAEFFRWFSEEAVRARGSWVEAPLGGSRILTMRQPVGPCLLVTPWNFPAAMVTRKVGPAVAAGCTMVLKPAEESPLSALALAAILEEAGLPDGVLNVVTTSRPEVVTREVLADRRLRKLSFTGSTEVGRHLLAAAAPGVLRCSMELGGNAPFVVFADADIDAAIDGAVTAKMRNGGEACTSANRFYVHEQVAATFAEGFAARIASLRVGRGSSEGVEVGPLVNERARAKVEDLVADARGAGARVLTGGGPIEGQGYFFTPTLLCDVPPDARVMQEEIFGPVAPLTTFNDEEELIACVNATDYGLVSYVYTSDLDRAVRMAEALEYGMVGVNTGIVSNPAAPFGGVKHSGIGREGGHEGIDEYLEVKYVAMKAGI